MKGFGNCRLATFVHFFLGKFIDFKEILKRDLIWNEIELEIQIQDSIKENSWCDWILQLLLDIDSEYFFLYIVLKRDFEIFNMNSKSETQKTLEYQFFYKLYHY